MDTNENGANRRSRSAPPYGSFTTFWNFVEELSQRGAAPQVLDDAVFGNRSKGSRFDVLSVLQFLELTDRHRRPTDAGRTFLEGPTVERLRELIEKYYAPVIDLGLQTATAGQVDGTLKSMGTNDGTLDKTRRFFLRAAQKVGIELGPHLRTSPGPSRGPSPTRRQRAKTAPKSVTESQPSHQSDDLWRRYVEMLMDKATAQDAPEEALLDRIERALKEAPRAQNP